MSERHILAIDQGTTSSRAMIFDETGQSITATQVEQLTFQDVPARLAKYLLTLPGAENGRVVLRSPKASLAFVIAKKQILTHININYTSRPVTLSHGIEIPRSF